MAIRRPREVRCSTAFNLGWEACPLNLRLELWLVVVSVEVNASNNFQVWSSRHKILRLFACHSACPVAILPTIRLPEDKLPNENAILSLIYFDYVAWAEWHSRLKVVTAEGHGNFLSESVLQGSTSCRYRFERNVSLSDRFWSSSTKRQKHISSCREQGFILTVVQIIGTHTP
jgi:hypothetical protein